MNFGKAFVFMFEDTNWLGKLVIGVLIALAGIVLSPVVIGVLGFVILSGYSLDVTRKVLHGETSALPEWSDWGAIFVRGLKLSIALVIWSLPLIVASIPVSLGGTWLGNNQSGAAQASGGLLIACGSCVMILWGLFVTLITPAIYVRLAAEDRFGAAFQLGQLWGLTSRNLGHVIIAILLTLVAGLIGAVAGFLGVFLCIGGLLITIPLGIFWPMLVAGHLYGQVGAVDTAATTADASIEPAG